MAASAALAALVFGPSLAMATDANVEQQLNDMQSRMKQMEDKLQATNDQLESANKRVDEQSQVIENAGLAETRGTSNGLPGFLGQIKIGGWVAASYFYNLNDPQDHALGGLGDTNQGIDQAFFPFHPDHNSFALDQAWWEIEREINEDNRAGFRFDVAYGKTAELLGGPGNRCVGSGCENPRDNSDTGIYLDQAYIQYLAPVGNGVTFKFGKFNTLIGTEVAQTVYNWNITRGDVYNLLEPIDHIGILASYAFGDTGFDAAIGGVNGFNPDDPDNNDAKSIIWHFGWANDVVTAGVNGIWGSEGKVNGTTHFDGDERGLVNGLVKIKASDRLGFWINGDYAWTKGDAAGWGIAAAGRFGITERTGISLRGEYVADVDQLFGFSRELSHDGFGVPTCTPSGRCVTGMNAYSLTATLDHLLTDNLMIRGEVRYDRVDKDSGSNDEFFHDSQEPHGFELSPDQIVLGVEAIYNFNKFGGE
jgi:hypothetical protein